MNQGYKSVTLLAADNPNLAEYLAQLERERDDMLVFIREQVELWDNAGDSGFPLYDHGKQILARYPLPKDDSRIDEVLAAVKCWGGQNTIA